jgi:hypothetical protein
MKAINQGIKVIAAVILAAAATGCASVSFDNDGTGNGASHDQRDPVLAQMENDSRGK